MKKSYFTVFEGYEFEIWCRPLLDYCSADHLFCMVGKIWVKDKMTLQAGDGSDSINPGVKNIEKQFVVHDYRTFGWTFCLLEIRSQALTWVWVRLYCITVNTLMVDWYIRLVDGDSGETISSSCYLPRNYMWSHSSSVTLCKISSRSLFSDRRWYIMY